MLTGGQGKGIIGTIINYAKLVDTEGHFEDLPTMLLER